MGAGCSTIDGQLGEHDRCRPRLPRSVKQRRERRQKKKYTKPRKERKRRHVLQALNAEAQTGELLSRIPGRICINGSTSSACAFTQQGKKGVNQDALLVWEQFASRRDTLLCAVFDGHGPYGHLVSRRVRDMLPSKLVTAWKAHMRGELDNMDNGYASKDSEDESLEEDEEGYDTEEYAGNWPEHIGQTKQANPGLGKRIEDEQRRRQGHLVMRAWKECLMKTFRSMDRDLRVQPTIDCFCSGTTAILLVQQGSELIIGNVGDSRAVLATFDEGTTALDCGTSKISEVGHLRAIQLSVDLKPNLPKEQARIRRCKGRVFAASDEPDVPRVWLPYDSAPGLAMARAFGDFCLKDYGLISVPDITYWTLSPDDQFVILATDGIWDVMSNTEAVEVVASAPSRVTAARLLVEGAAKLWKQKYPTSRADDCAATKMKSMAWVMKRTRMMIS
ncbi:hypothetical protein KP509_05G067100 [Ceratopteris richardii]|uniref:PPM-type phosphatase domain-containing protein n=1 Tax=Ceratopteris richardii TaxID=49495 RepID=A0A8T2UMH7_CERRI|nr:hypothetical protein KP509_05G067100 [Ceratopteris richardii]